MTLAGLKSRWTRPAPWIDTSASASAAANEDEAITGHRTVAMDLGVKGGARDVLGCQPWLPGSGVGVEIPGRAARRSLGARPRPRDGTGNGTSGRRRTPPSRP